MDERLRKLRRMNDDELLGALMSDNGLLEAFEKHVALRQAIDSAWRWVLRTKHHLPVKVSEVVDRVVVKCAEADRKYVAGVIEHRLMNQRPYRPRQRRRAAQAV